MSPVYQRETQGIFVTSQRGVFARDLGDFLHQPGFERDRLQSQADQPAVVDLQVVGRPLLSSGCRRG